MGTYTLQVNIDPSIFPTLANAGYKLCIAKKVNNQYTVVWSGTTFLVKNTFQWTEEYQMFCTQKFTAGALVSASTVDQPIQYGQTCTLDKIGQLGPATGTISPTGTFYLVNNYSAINPGVNGNLGGTFSPIFVSPNPVVPGSTNGLSPIIRILAWFDLQLVTSTMFLDSVSNSIETVYQGTTTHTIFYTAQGTWSAQNSLGQVAVQPRRSYHPEHGFSYEDSDVDPHALIQGALASDYSGTDRLFPPAEWLAECKVSFPNPGAADEARAYLKQKIIYNIQQSVSAKTDDATFNVKLRWAPVTFMTESMAGSTDEEKIQNAFNAELGLLSVPPTSSQYLDDQEHRILPKTVALLSSGTHIALDREVGTAVVGDQYRRTENQEWNILRTGRRGYFIIQASSGGTYLSFDGKPHQGAPVIHSKEKTIWHAEPDSGHVRIIVPGTDYCVELGHEHKKVRKVVLAARIDGDNKQLWKPLSPLLELETK